jgi:protein TonB
MKNYSVILAACSAIAFAMPISSRAEISTLEYEAEEPPLHQLRRTFFRSIDDYKVQAATKILHFNGAHTFSCKLPPMLPAVVVLRITVGKRGQIVDAWVQRAPDGDKVASNIALESMYRTGVLPPALNLASGPSRLLSYSETFLFNSENLFQIRTLAPVQTPD